MWMSGGSDVSESVANLALRLVAKKLVLQAAYLAFHLLADQRWCFRLVQAGDTVLFKRLA